MNVATATIVLPAESAPSAAPAIETLVMTVDASGDRKRVDGGIVVQGTPLLIGFRTVDVQGQVAVVTKASINGRALGVVEDADGGGTALPVNYLVRDPDTSDGLFTPPLSGVYTVSAEAQPPTGAPVKVTVVIRATGEEGGIDTLEDVPPVIRRVVPRPGTSGVSTATFVDVAFSEPVRNVYWQIQLVSASGRVVPLKLMGLTAEETPRLIELKTFEHPAITAVTLIPQSGLEYATEYTVVASPLIVDLDTNPRNMVCTSEDDPEARPCESRFTTFGPVNVGQADPEKALAGLAVLGDRALCRRDRLRRRHRRRHRGPARLRHRRPGGAPGSRILGDLVPAEGCRRGLVGRAADAAGWDERDRQPEDGGGGRDAAARLRGSTRTAPSSPGARPATSSCSTWRATRRSWPGPAA